MRGKVMNEVDMAFPIKRIAVTGAAGLIAYSLLFRLADGGLFKDYALDLRLLEVPEALAATEGVRLELEDGAYPLLDKITVTVDAYEAFDNVDIAILVGAKPRSAGMERKELLQGNGAIFVEQGRALDAAASPHTNVVVVGNPCNTNCLIALKQAKRLSVRAFHAMTRLDQNRAVGLLARRCCRPVLSIKNAIIWGNHSSTQVPDGFHALVDGKEAPKFIGDDTWLKGAFMNEVQQRGAAIIAARGKSSAASAAQAILDHLRALYTPTPAGEYFSMAVYSQGNPYGIDEDLIFSFPCRSRGDGTYEIVAGLSWNDIIKEKIALTVAELQEERQILSALG